jgi:signal transduction histidine kinase/HAMP domain-containing protein
MESMKNLGSWIKTKFVNRGIMGKLILIFVAIKVLPVILLAWTARQQVTSLGAEVEGRSVAMMSATRDKIREIGDIAVSDSVAALDRRSRESIEHLTTDTAHAVADFLYDRDRDIRVAASLAPDEQVYRGFLAQQMRSVVEHGAYRLDPKGERWTPVAPPPARGPEVRSAIRDNEKEWHYRPPEGGGSRVARPLYLEMTFIDLQGNERVKVTSSGLLPAGLRNVSRRENTYCRAESYFRDLQRLKPGEIAVSEVIGPYVGTPLIGPFTPKRAREAGVPFAPEKAGYAGKENPVGKRFRGLIRWGMPVVRQGRVTGYVTLALDHRHLKEFTDHLIPTDERFSAITDASSGNYAFIWDYKGRSIVHPRDSSIVGYDPATGEPAVPWLDSELYRAWVQSGQPIGSFLERQPPFSAPSLKKRPAPELTRAGNVGLDGRYLNFAPQCAGWHELTSRGGSGSFVIFWSGLWKLTTAASIPYYTGRYGAHPRGFGYVTVGANVDEFHLPATLTASTITRLVAGFTREIDLQQGAMRELVGASIAGTTGRLSLMTAIMVILVVVIAILMAGFLTARIRVMISGIRRFQEGELTARLPVASGDEMGALAGAINDMAEAIQLREKALLASKEEEKFHNLILSTQQECSIDGILVVDDSGDIFSYNRRFVELWNIPQALVDSGEDAPVLRHVAAQSSQPEAFLSRVRHLYGHHEERSHEEIVLSDGRTIDRYTAPMQGEDGKYYGRVWYFRDITDLQRARLDLLKTQKLESLGVLAGGIAHDFNNILTAVLGNVSLARFQLGDPSKAELRLEEAEKAALRAKDLTQQLLTFARGGEPVKKVIALSALLRESAGFAVHGSAIRCDFELPDDLWSVEADEGQLSQVVHNLVLNAVQAMPGGGSLTIAARNLPAGEGGAFLLFRVSDTGTGISQDHLHNIFDPYFTTKPSGNGLGLATCYSIVKKHEGTIRVESEPGKGTSFFVTLPASDRVAPAQEPRPQAARNGRGRVMVMDDEETVCLFAAACLEELGYQVECAGNGSAAVELYRQRQREGTPFAAVIMDLTVPGGMGGKEAIALLLQLDPEVKAIVSSGYATDPVMANFRDYGFCAVLCKPYRLQELGEVLKGCAG